MYKFQRHMAIICCMGAASAPAPSAADNLVPNIANSNFTTLSAPDAKQRIQRLRRVLPKIIGGSPAAPGEFPYQVNLMFSSKFDESPAIDRHFCGGSIIGNQWVLTAAHCVVNFFGNMHYISVGSGSVELDKLEEFEVDGAWMHPKFNGETLDYDFAIIRTQRPFSDPEIQVVDRADNQHISTGSKAVITGWGVDEKGNIQPKLLKAEVSVQSRVDCNDSNSYNGAVTARMICLGRPEGGKDTCQGDSGGPAVARLPSGARVLFGSTSWGEGCGEKDKYGVYGRLISVKSWIDGVLNSVD